MKKFLAIIVCIGLLSSSIASAIGPKRIWQCGTAPTKNKCSSAEISEARKWLASSTFAALLTLLGLIGITVTTVQAKLAQDNAIIGLSAQEAYEQNQKTAGALAKRIDTRIAELETQSLTADQRAALAALKARRNELMMQ